ncbi:hypothetical protein J2853_000741 [Streptosporangium lutulentum]|uniref:Uncharacterized protein n=1 Tax=Streptosporangium lutulentum TaxID=1461250 RepID=A0ABT9Q471_9ACTN|nr:hypothetical protein [Streptosporangium lutulentum]
MSLSSLACRKGHPTDVRKASVIISAGCLRHAVPG